MGGGGGGGGGRHLQILRVVRKRVRDTAETEKGRQVDYKTEKKKVLR